MRFLLWLLVIGTTLTAVWAVGVYLARRGSKFSPEFLTRRYYRRPDALRREDEGQRPSEPTRSHTRT